MKKTITTAFAMAVSCGVSTLTPAQAADGVAALPMTPSAWRIEAKAGDQVEMKEANGILTLTYDVAITEYNRVGHQSFSQGTFKLLLKEPLALTPAQARVLFEAVGVSEDNSLRPLVLDANDELLGYTPHSLWTPRTTTKIPVDQWVKWTSRPFWTTEAGGAAQEIYNATGGDGNSWPDGTLRFIGFQGRLLAPPKSPEKGAGSLAPLRRKGIFHVANVQMGGAQVPAGEPTIFADAILEKKGRHRIGLEIRDVFQGIPYLEQSVEIDYDPADPVSRHQPVAFPVGNVKNSWITCGVVAPDGTATTVEFRWEKNLPPSATRPPAVDATQPPTIGLLRINPDAHAQGVYQADEPLTVTVRVFKKTTQIPAKLKWTLSPYRYEDVLESGEANLDFPAAGRLDLPLTVQAKGRNAFTLTVVLTAADGKELDRCSYVLGIVQKSIEPYTSRTGIIRGRDYVKKTSYNRITYGTEQKFKQEDDACRHFIEMLDESSQLTTNVTYMIDLADFEILPGVYDFALLDRLMDAAADRGCALTVRIGHAEQVAPYRWLPYTLPRNFDGDVIPGHRYYGAFVFADQGFVETWFKTFEALHARYRNHPAFQGYYLLQPAGEWTFPDEPWMGNFAGYSWADADWFRNYLKDQLKLSLEQLNARWGTVYKEWSEVSCPAPDFSVGKQPDLRPTWVDFANFKNWLGGWWFPAVSAHIRTFDPDHVIIDYGGRGGNGEPQEGIVGVVDYLHNGGNHFLEGEGTMIDAWEKGQLGWITEPHHPHRWAAYGDPAGKGWVLDWSVFVMLSQAGAGGANLHVYYWANPTFDLAAHYGGAFAYDRYEKYKPILRELHGVRMVQAPKQVAVFQDVSTLLLKHRTAFGARLVDLRRWFDLLKQDSVNYEFYRPAAAANYKLLVMNPLDEVISPETKEAVVRLTNQGATLVLAARTGRYATDNVKVEYPLLKALGIPAPGGAYVTGEAAPTATVVEENPFLAKGAAIPFFTQAELRRELLDPEIGKNFWQWPFRWIPESDYFGYFKGNRQTGGQVLATFPDGGAAITLHQVGKGRALVFWGTPDMKLAPLAGFMARIAQASGVSNPRAGNAIPCAIEADHPQLKRHYVLLYQETPGTYVQKMPGVPDGDWFVDDMVSDHKFGLYAGNRLRAQGMSLTFTDGDSPLKILRLLPKDKVQAPWVDKYGGQQ